MGAFHGTVKIKRPPLTYALSLLGTLLVMLVLPVLYLALVAYVGWCVKQYVLYGAGWWAGIIGRRPMLVMVPYLAIGLSGVTLLVFLLKPLFMGRSKPPPSLEVTPETQPLLFEFIHRICDLVGSRPPDKVVVTCEVNAAAALTSLFSGRLELIIGLPLVGGLNAQQFGGTLAHEFGHFRQGLGMRMGAMLGRLNIRFIRMVAERDQLDQWIARWEASGLHILVLGGWLAKKMIGLGRIITCAFVWFARGVGGYRSRQMEFDADACMAAVAGSRQCSTILKRLQVLDVASEPALAHLHSFVERGRLPDNIPDLIAEWEAEMPLALRRKLDAATSNDKASWTSTHPATSDRIEAALALEHPGVFHSDLPASALFAGYDALCREATMHFYEVDHEHQLRGMPVFSLKEARAKADLNEVRVTALKEFFGGKVNVMRYPVLPAASPQQWQAAHALTTQHRALYFTMAEEWLDQWNLRETKQMGQALLNAGCRVDKLTHFFTRTHSEEAALEELHACDKEVKRIAESLAPYEAAAWTRISAALAWRYSSDPGVTDVWRKEVTALVAAQRCLVPAVVVLERHSPAWHCADVLSKNASATPVPAQAYAMSREHEKSIAKLKAELRAAMQNTVDPYCPQGRLLSETLVPTSPYGNDELTAQEDFSGLNRTIIPVLHDITGDLCRMALEVEEGWKKASATA